MVSSGVISASASLLVVGLIGAVVLGGVGWWLLHPPGQAAKQAANPHTNTPLLKKAGFPE